MRKLKVAITGLGRAGRFMHIPELEQNADRFTIAAVCDRDPERLKDLPPFAGDAKTYTDFEEMLRDPEVELVTIAIRNADHVPYALKALSAGKKVFLEKPAAVSMAQLDELKKANAQYPGHLFLRFNRRFEPAFLALKQIVASGVLGRLTFIRITRQTGYTRRCDWQTIQHEAGGLLNNWGTHLIDQASQLLMAPADDIWCDMKHLVAEGDAEDQVKLLLRGRNGRVADIELTGTAAIQDSLYTLWGDRGTAVVNAAGTTIHLKYLDPEQRFPAERANAGQFPLQYGNPQDHFRWIDREVPVQDVGHTLQRGVLQAHSAVDPSKGYAHQDTIWRCLYDAVTGTAAYPIRFEEGYEVTRILLKAKEASGFHPAYGTGLELGPRSCVPAPKIENDCYDWYLRHECKVQACAERDWKVIFYGDSLTHFWSGEDQDHGNGHWGKHFGNKSVLNCGFGFDRTQNVLYRIRNGEFPEKPPELIVLNIGTNHRSITEHYTGDDDRVTAQGILAVVDLLHERAPEAKLIVMDLFPRGGMTEWINAVNRALHDGLKSRPFVREVDIGPVIGDENRAPRPEFYQPDLTHVNERTYEAWRKAIAGELEEALS